MQLGYSAQFSGTLLAMMTVGQTAARCCCPCWHVMRIDADYSIDAGAAAYWLLRVYLAAAAAPAALGHLLRHGLGGAFPLCLVLALDHARHPAIAGRLVAFMQGIGFMSPALPLVVGPAASLSGNYQLDWMLHAVCVLL
jgi:CP family cyanate transporter-like MFS transporter